MSFVLLALFYTAGFVVSTRTDAAAAWDRFELLVDAGYPGRARGHGDRAFGLWRAEHAAETFLQPRRLRLADAHYDAGDRPRAIEHYSAALASREARRLENSQRIEIRRRIATMELKEGHPIPAAIIAARFVESAGDAVAGAEHSAGDPQKLHFLSLVDALEPAFLGALPPDGSGVKIDGTPSAMGKAADAMVTLGGYYALQDDGAYAAAGLLAAAHRIRERHLGPQHEDTVQTALLLAPVYERIDRLSDAERLYEDVFRAMEAQKGANNPELSLYIRLLSGIYEKQGRLTQAEALNQHMRKIFRDAFGARRYAANRSRERLFDVNRPVSMTFPLESNYRPPDLVAANDFEIPLSKAADVEEMQLRQALVDNTSMPEALAGLLEACSSEEETLSLRSAYRSHKTQVLLHELNGEKGTVAHPGTSEHQLGLAADIDVNRRFMRATDRAFSCFEKKAWQYGFILSFPAGNTYLPGTDSFEPWHWRFVGPKTALLYREIGPWGRPQEFLAALPCYEERALSGLFVDRETGDMCLQSIGAQAEERRDT